MDTIDIFVLKMNVDTEKLAIIGRENTKHWIKGLAYIKKIISPGMDY